MVRGRKRLGSEVARLAMGKVPRLVLDEVRALDLDNPVLACASRVPVGQAALQGDAAVRIRLPTVRPSLR